MNHSEDNKRIAKNTLLLYLRMMFVILISLYTSRVVLNTLGVEDFGVYNVVGGVVAMLAFLNNSLGAATSRFITFSLGKGDFSDLKKTFANILAIHIFLALIVLILAETLGLWFLNNYINVPLSREYAAFWVFQFSVLTSAISLISVPYNATIIAHERMSAFAYISILDITLKLLIAFLIQIVNFDRLIFYASLICFAQVLIQFIYFLYCRKNFKETLSFPRIDAVQSKSILSFAGWTMNGNLAVMGYTRGLNILLNMFFGPVVNAARGIAVQVQTVLQNFCVNFQMALNPQLTKSYAQQNFEHMHQLLVTSSKFSFFLLLFVALPTCIEAPLVLYWWLGLVPDYTVIFLRLILAFSLLNALANPIIVSVHATGNLKKFQLIEGTMLLCIVPIAYIGLKFFHFPPEYVFITHIIVEIITQYVRLRIVLPMIQMKMSVYVKNVFLPIMKVFVCMPILPIVVYGLLEENVVSFFIVCFTSVISSVIVVYFLGCTLPEKQFVVSKCNQLFNRFRR